MEWIRPVYVSGNPWCRAIYWSETGQCTFFVFLLCFERFVTSIHVTGNCFNPISQKMDQHTGGTKHRKDKQLQSPQLPMIYMKHNGIFCPLTHHSPYDSNVLRGTNRHIYAWKRGVLVFDINNAILGRPIIYVPLSVRQACKIKQSYKSPFPDVRPSITICNEDVIWMSTIWYMVGIKFIPEITHLTTWDP